MKESIKIPLLFLFTISLLSLSGSSSVKYKCLIQMSNYNGEGAYVVISLINAKGQYEKTIYVQGKDKEWYSELNAWWKFYGKKRHNIDGITGGTIASGARTLSVLQIDNSSIDKGYKLRFETAVEEKNYFEKDVEFELSTANLQKKFSGKGFIRYVRMLPQ